MSCISPILNYDIVVNKFLPEQFKNTNIEEIFKKSIKSTI
jgi:hypothetical protein